MMMSPTEKMVTDYIKEPDTTSNSLEWWRAQNIFPQLALTARQYLIISVRGAWWKGFSSVVMTVTKLGASLDLDSADKLIFSQHECV